MSKNTLNLKAYENKWVALTYPDNLIVGSGETLAEAKQTAMRKGYKKPVFYKVPLDAFYIPMLCSPWLRPQPRILPLSTPQARTLRTKIQWPLLQSRLPLTNRLTPPAWMMLLIPHCLPCSYSCSRHCSLLLSSTGTLLPSAEGHVLRSPK